MLMASHPSHSTIILHRVSLGVFSLDPVGVAPFCGRRRPIGSEGFPPTARAREQFEPWTTRTLLTVRLDLHTDLLVFSFKLSL